MELIESLEFCLERGFLIESMIALRISERPPRPLRTRRRIDAGLKAKIALEALREQATVTDIAQRYEVHPNQTYAWKKQLQDQAARAFDLGVGRDAETTHEREIERLHAKIGQLTVERDFLARRSGR